MLEVKFYETDEIDDSLLRYAVIVSRYRGQWVLCKHKERNTWEVPGGHREAGETALDAAKRELYEETGAVEFAIQPVCVYAVQRGTESHGMLFYADIAALGALPDTEIERIGLFDETPGALTYPLIQPKLIDRVAEVLRAGEPLVESGPEETEQN